MQHFCVACDHRLTCAIATLFYVGCTYIKVGKYERDSTETHRESAETASLDRLSVVADFAQPDTQLTHLRSVVLEVQLRCNAQRLIRVPVLGGDASREERGAAIDVAVRAAVDAWLAPARLHMTAWLVDTLARSFFSHNCILIYNMQRKISDGALL